MLIYKTTNQVNGKIYIGQCLRDNPNYFGSGTAIKAALKKHGKSSFKREVLMRCKTQKQLDLFEKHFIEKFDSCNRKVGYNILPGTSNGFGSGSPMLIEAVRLKVSVSMKRRYKEDPSMGLRISKAQKRRFEDPGERQKVRVQMAVKIGELNNNYGNKWTAAQKQNLSEKMTGRYDGVDNPNFGNVWSEDKKKALSIKKSKRLLMLHPETLEILREFLGSKDAADQTGISRGSITACAGGYNKTAGNHKWRYED